MNLNPFLCNIETIQWWDLLDKTSNPILDLAAESSPRECR